MGKSIAVRLFPPARCACAAIAMNAFVYPEWPAPAQVHALTTTRVDGTSSGSYSSFNLADHVGDKAQSVAANRLQLHALLPNLPAEPLWLNQVHGSHAVFAESALPGAEADASICCDERHVCAILSADCLPILLCDDRGTVVAAAHAGWRGLVAGVVEATIARMDVNAAHLLTWLGPAIGPQAFEVGEDVRSIFVAHDPAAESAFVALKPGKWLCDLYLLARQRLAAAGVTKVYGGNFCTFNEAERFYSYRRDQQTGRMATLIWLDRMNPRV